MNAETFSEFLRQPEKLFQLSYQELKSLSLEYPSVQLLRQLLLLKSQYDGNKEYAKNLHRASGGSPDRRFLYEWLQAHAQKLPESQALELNEDYLELKDLRELDNFLSAGEITETPGYAAVTPSPAVSSIPPIFPETEPEEEFQLPDLPLTAAPTPARHTPDSDLIDTLTALSTLIDFKPLPQQIAPPATPPIAPPPVTPPPNLRIIRTEGHSQKLSVQIQTLEHAATYNKPKPKGKSKKTTTSGGIASETLAKLLAHQGYHDKAIAMYQQLSLDIPEKSRYFADQIKKLQKQID